MPRRARIFKRLLLPLRFRRNESGATAVEFALISIPFLALLGAILELGFLFMGSVALDNAMASATRRIRTGELKNASNADAGAKETNRLAFRDEICDGMGIMATDCKAKLTVDVRTAAQFNNVNVPNPIQNGTFSPGALQFETGGPSTIVVVTAYYRWTMFMPLMNQALQRLPGETLLTSATTFQTEPY
jgi:Flp pilus assembly protein TadG